MSIELAATLFGFLATIGGFVFYFGQLDVRIKNTEQRAKEDREHNADQHKEFYVVKTEVTQITAQFVDFDRRMSAIEDTLREILSRLPNRRTNNG
jgi:septal ring factor EnvC (AmiA/AmiB activator)